MPVSPAPTEGILGSTYRASTIGAFTLIVIAAFEALAVTTVMPTISRELDGVSLYALSFSAPLASGVIGMVAAGQWSDRHGPRRALEVAIVVFSLGLLVCGLAPTMEVFVGGRLLQGLGSGGLIAALYVVVGEVYPSALQPSVFASFAAAWVLPALFGPALAALVADAVGWRWVFLSVIVLVGVATIFVVPALRMLRPREALAGPPDPAVERRSRSRMLLWAVVAASAALALDLIGSLEGAQAALVVVPLVALVVALRPLLPGGTLLGRRGLPSVIGTRGLLSASFFCSESYIVFVLQEQWQLSAVRAGLALSVVGVVWALASQAQARLSTTLGHTAVMSIGSVLLLVGAVVLLVAVVADIHPVLAAAGYGIGGAGMGFAYPRTGVATLAASTDADRGFNSSAVTIADSLGGAVALSISGALFAVYHRGDGDPFVAVFALATVLAIGSVVVALRTEQPG
ncbi:MFS transporter [Janibacter endophyticus]|uniref:MFS transporter n=1 Tax=Janibacter endophyticus TaxID=2806261 RepID=UPI0027DBF533|nr:MFS transporter [Janibacter endophyticus]